MLASIDNMVYAICPVEVYCGPPSCLGLLFIRAVSVSELDLHCGKYTRRIFAHACLLVKCATRPSAYLSLRCLRAHHAASLGR